MARPSFRKDLTAALERDVQALLVRTRGETLYAVALYTSGMDDFSYVLTSANTEEGLAEARARRAQEDPSSAGPKGDRRLRFSPADWKYHGAMDAVQQLELPPGDGDARDASLYRDFVAALKAVGARGLLPEQPRPLLLVLCGDMDDAFLHQGLARLNPPQAVRAFHERYGAAAFRRELAALRDAGEVGALAALYRDLSLERPSALADEARDADVSAFDVEEFLVGLGAPAVDGLIDLVEAHGFVSTDPSGATPDEWKQAGLASSAVFLLPTLGKVTDAQVERLHGLLVRRIHIDQPRPRTTTLTENIARVLSQLRPRRFPGTWLNPRTNHLGNPGPFLAPPGAGLPGRRTSHEG